MAEPEGLPLFYRGEVTPEAFQREMTCTEGLWLSWVGDGIAPTCTWQRHGAIIDVAFPPGDGRLRLSWTVLPTRVMGLVQLPRLLVTFEFQGLDADQRRAFMHRFDLYTQRGGG